MNSEQGDTSSQKFKPWGIQVSHPGVVYSGPWNCPECYWDLEGLSPKWEKFIVGFSTNVPPNPHRTEENRIKDGYIGGIVVECPKCSQKFWFHITLQAMEIIYE